jgi:hypothetical protein
MGVRRDKGTAVARYIGAHTGMPSIHWDYSGLHAPKPYDLTLITNRKLDMFTKELNREHEGIWAAIRYDYGMSDLNHAWVGMHLKDYVTLLTTHYETIQDRIKGE